MSEETIDILQAKISELQKDFKDFTVTWEGPLKSLLTADENYAIEKLASQFYEYDLKLGQIAEHVDHSVGGYREALSAWSESNKTLSNDVASFKKVVTKWGIESGRKLSHITSRVETYNIAMNGEADRIGFLERIRNVETGLLRVEQKLSDFERSNQELRTDILTKLGESERSNQEFRTDILTKLGESERSNQEFRTDILTKLGESERSNQEFHISITDKYAQAQVDYLTALDKQKSDIMKQIGSKLNFGLMLIAAMITLLGVVLTRLPSSDSASSEQSVNSTLEGTAKAK
jgi:predicted DNA-binding protein YlxM (UPF0122 family)